MIQKEILDGIPEGGIVLVMRVGDVLKPITLNKSQGEILSSIIASFSAEQPLQLINPGIKIDKSCEG